MEEDIIMSILDEYIQITGKCALLDARRIPDGVGGYKIQYVESIEFDAAIAKNTSIEAQIAEKQGVTGLYQVSTSRNIKLQYHDVFRRKSDGKIFRVTSDGTDMAAPPSSKVDMRVVTAEEYTLPIQ